MFYLFIYDWSEVAPKIEIYNDLTEALLAVPLTTLDKGKWNMAFKALIDSKVRFHGLDRYGFEGGRK